MSGSGCHRHGPGRAHTGPHRIASHQTEGGSSTPPRPSRQDYHGLTHSVVPASHSSRQTFTIHRRHVSVTPTAGGRHRPPERPVHRRWKLRRSDHPRRNDHKVRRLLPHLTKLQPGQFSKIVGSPRPTIGGEHSPVGDIPRPLAVRSAPVRSRRTLTAPAATQSWPPPPPAAGRALHVR